MTQLEKDFTANQNLVFAILRKFRINKSNTYYNDYLQEGNLALLKSIETFDRNKNTKLSTYAYGKISYAIQDFRKNNLSILKTGTTKKDRKEKNYNPKVTNYDDPNYNNIPKISNNIIDKIDLKNNLNILRKAFLVLTEKEKDIILKYYKENYTFTKIAELYRVSKAAIHKSYKKALQKMKNYFSLIPEEVRES